MNEHEKDDVFMGCVGGICLCIIFIGWLTGAVTLAIWIITESADAFHSVGTIGAFIAFVGIMLSFLAISGSRDGGIS